MRRFALALPFLCGCGGTSAPTAAGSELTMAPVTIAAPVSLEPDAASLRVLVAGDVIPHRPKLVEAESVAGALEPLAPLFAKANAVIANHEAAIVPAVGRYEAVRAALVVAPEWTHALARGGVAAVTLANNHACDAGLDGLSRTMDVVDDVGLVGVGADHTDPFRARVLAASGGRRVCAVAWTAHVNVERSQCRTSGKLAIAPYGDEGIAAIERAVKAARSSGCDAVLAIGHAGDEYAPQIAEARAQAIAAARAGAAAVVLHHPHVPSGIETVSVEDGRRVPIFLSIGNLLSNQGEAWREGMRATGADRRRVSRNAWTRVGIVPDFSFRWERGAKETASLTWGYHLVWTDRDAPSLHRNKIKSRESGIVVRPFDVARDAAIVRALEADPLGPKRLFDSPCHLATGPGCK